jgi:hypothetical protein
MSYKNLKLIATTLATLCYILFSIYASAMDSDESGAYANFIRDMVSNMNLEKSGSFCIIGNDEVAKALAAQNRSVVRLEGDVNIKKYDSCNIVYISQGTERGLRIELDRLAEKRILTVAIFDGFTTMGGMIQIQLGRRNFELTVNSKLLKHSGVRLGVLATNLIIN